MDPNETLKICREAITNYNQCNVNLDPDGCMDALLELSTAFQRLDRWMAIGRFKPDAWDK